MISGCGSQLFSSVIAVVYCPIASLEEIICRDRPADSPPASIW